LTLAEIWTVACAQQRTFADDLDDQPLTLAGDVRFLELLNEATSELMRALNLFVHDGALPPLDQWTEVYELRNEACRRRAARKHAEERALQ
jgi:hypothetical protein